MSGTKDIPASADVIEKQLQKVKTDISIWQLMQNLVEHRQALLASLTKMNTPEESTPKELINLVTND